MTTRRQMQGAEVLRRAVPFTMRRYYFGDRRQGNLAQIRVEDLPPERQAETKALLGLSKRVLRMDEMTAIRMCDERFRQWLLGVAAPFEDLEAVYLVPVALVQQVAERAEAWVAERRRLVAAAKAAYPAQVEIMRGKLGPLFNRRDYPEPDRFAAMFSAEWRFVDFGVPGMMEAIDADLFERERQKFAEVGDRARQAIERHLASSLLDITAHLSSLLHPKANGRKPALRDGALDRLFRFLDTIEARDVTNFRDLRAASEALRRASRGVSVNALREDEQMRARMAATVDEIREAVSGLVTDDGARALRIREEAS